MSKAKYNDRRYVARREALRRKTKANGDPCCFCKRAIDWSVDWKHPDSFTAHHVEELNNGGHLLGELLPAHRGCNSRWGDGSRAPKVIEAPVTSRKW